MPQGPIRKGAGQLRHRIELQSATPIIDAMGGRSLAWAAYADDVPAAVEPQAGIIGADKAEVITLITMRYDSRVLAEQRVVHDGITYTVLAVINPERRNRELIMHCMELTV